MGRIDVLNVGAGHLRIEVDESDPEGTDKARRIIEDMMGRGYAIMVETERGLRRVKRFNPKRMSYIVSDVPEGPPEVEVPAASVDATAIGRSAGG